jgi:hypothetical protein
MILSRSSLFISIKLIDPSIIYTYIVIIFLNVVFNAAAARYFLSENGWTQGLQDVMIKNMVKVPLRYFLCDDSGSMSSNDGHRSIPVGRSKKFVGCSRWAEMTDALRFHAKFSNVACVTSEFRFLNGETVRLGCPGSVDMNVFEGILDGSPGTSLYHLSLFRLRY